MGLVRIATAYGSPGKEGGARGCAAGLAGSRVRAAAAAAVPGLLAMWLSGGSTPELAGAAPPPLRARLERVGDIAECDALPPRWPAAGVPAVAGAGATWSDACLPALPLAPV